MVHVNSEVSALTICVSFIFLKFFIHTNQLAFTQISLLRISLSKDHFTCNYGCKLASLTLTSSRSVSETLAKKEECNIYSQCRDFRVRMMMKFLRSVPISRSRSGAPEPLKKFRPFEKIFFSWYAEVGVLASE